MDSNSLVRLTFLPHTLLNWLNDLSFIPTSTSTNKDMGEALEVV